jgi:hypothetical protein
MEDRVDKRRLRDDLEVLRVERGLARRAPLDVEREDPGEQLGLLPSRASLAPPVSRHAHPKGVLTAVPHWQILESPIPNL